MGKISVPVMPYIANFGGIDNVVLSLTDIAPPNRIRLLERSEPGVTYQQVDLKVVNTNISALGSLGFGDFVSTKLSSKCFCSYMDLIVTREMPANLDPNSIIVGATFGLGFRMAIVAYDVDASLSSNFSGIAAAAKLKMGSTSYQILSIGGGLDVIAAAQPLVANLSGDFTVETLETIGFVQAQLADLFINKNPKLMPELVSVELDLDRMAKLYSGETKSLRYMDMMRGQHYALQRARKNRTLEEALADADKNADWSKVDRDVVKDFYQRILELKPNQKPDSDFIKKRIRIMVEAGT
jgi:hypothetical protein